MMRKVIIDTIHFYIFNLLLLCKFKRCGSLCHSFVFVIDKTDQLIWILFSHHQFVSILFFSSQLIRRDRGFQIVYLSRLNPLRHPEACSKRTFFIRKRNRKKSTRRNFLIRTEMISACMHQRDTKWGFFMHKLFA